MADFHSIIIKAGVGGWGGPITISPTEEYQYAVPVIHPWTRRGHRAGWYGLCSAGLSLNCSS